MKETFGITVSFTQLAVFSPDVEEPFNSWTDEQVDVGYSWRPESVSFGMEDDGPHKVTICVEPVMPSRAESALHKFDVTFEASRSNEVEIASISDSKVVPLRHGIYRLRCEVLPDDEVEAHVRLMFVPEIRVV